MFVTIGEATAKFTFSGMYFASLAINNLFNPEKDILVICGGDSELLTKSLKTQKENIIKAPNLVMEGMIIHNLTINN